MRQVTVIVVAFISGYLACFVNTRPRDVVEISRTADRAVVREYDQRGKATVFERDLNAPIRSVFRVAKPPDYHFEMVLRTGAMAQPLDLREVTADRCLIWVSEDGLSSDLILQAYSLCIDASLSEAEREIDQARAAQSDQKGVIGQ